MSAYFVVIKDGAIIDCTSDSSVATERFLSKKADRMEKVSSLEDVQRICDTDWEEEDCDPEVVIASLWSYLDERIERLGRRIRETEIPDVEGVKDLAIKTIERASNKVREAGKQGIGELRELLDKLRRRKKLDEEEGVGEEK